MNIFALSLLLCATTHFAFAAETRSAGTPLLTSDEILSRGAAWMARTHIITELAKNNTSICGLHPNYDERLNTLLAESEPRNCFDSCNRCLARNRWTCASTCACISWTSLLATVVGGCLLGGSVISCCAADCTTCPSAACTLIEIGAPLAGGGFCIGMGAAKMAFPLLPGGGCELIQECDKVRFASLVNVSINEETPLANLATD